MSRRLKRKPARADVPPKRKPKRAVRVFPLPLSHAEKLAAFSRCTRALPKWYPDKVKRGMTDAELTQALAAVLGTGGSSGPGEINIWHEGAGLRIWASREFASPHRDRPIFAGAATLALARDVYRIPDPNNRQLSLLTHIDNTGGAQ